MLKADVFFHIQRLEILRHIRRNSNLLVILAVYRKARLQRHDRPAHLIGMPTDFQPQGVHHRLVRVIAAASPAEPVRAESPIHVESFGSPFAGITPSQPNVIPKRGFILRIARIAADARHRPPGLCIQSGVNELHDRRKLLAQLPQGGFDILLIPRPIGFIELLMVIKPNIIQEVECFL